jgi:hypothetical protein
MPQAETKIGTLANSLIKACDADLSTLSGMTPVTRVLDKLKSLAHGTARSEFHYPELAVENCPWPSRQNRLFRTRFGSSGRKENRCHDAALCFDRDQCYWCAWV